MALRNEGSSKKASPSGPPRSAPIKIHRSYTVPEIARLLTVHPRSVRNWLKDGLVPIDVMRPTCIHGQVLADYLRQRRADAKRPCGPGEIFCLPCRSPKSPAGSIADYTPITATSGNLVGILPDCGRLVYRRVALAKMDAIRGTLDVTFSDSWQRIGERPSLSVDCHFNAGDET